MTAQTVFIVLLAILFVAHTIHYGTRTGMYQRLQYPTASYWDWVIRKVVLVGLLYWGGFFG